MYVTLCMFYRFIKFVCFLGNRAPVLIPNKLLYMASDLKLLSEYFGVPMFQPPNIYEKGIQATFLYSGSHDQIYNALCKPYLFSFSHKEKELCFFMFVSTKHKTFLFIYLFFIDLRENIFP